MRSPVIAFSLLAAAVSPTLIAGAPSGIPNIPGGVSVPHVPSAPSASGKLPTSLDHLPMRRADDGNTAGGNARTGGTGSSNGGAITNQGDNGTTLTNNGSSMWFFRFSLHLLSTLHCRRRWRW